MWGFFVIPHGNDTGGPFDPQEDGFIGSAAKPCSVSEGG
jgi:hypothetical protein